MPELPEVETVRRGLVPAMEGQVIASVRVNRPDLRWPFPARMAERLTGQKVLTLRRRSKYILADLASGESLLVHLGMSGRMLVSGRLIGAYWQQTGAEGGQPGPHKHDHVVIDMANGARITFNDPRRFGSMDLLRTDQADRHRLLAGLGPEPLGNSFDARYLAAALAGRRAPVKAALLDQRIIAGLGNIYVCEVLYRTGIDPRRPAAGLGADSVAALIPVIRDVLTQAIAAGGSTLQDYQQADGASGAFQDDFRVYGREGQPCLTPGCAGVITRFAQSGRSTFACPDCQR